jgi:hypothetical protein
MKLLKSVLDFFGAVVKAWPILALILGAVVSLIIGLTKIAKTVVPINIPLPLLILAGAFISYPFLKFIQWLVTRPMQPFHYAGLLWKPSKLTFLHPKPLCPREGCGCEIRGILTTSADIVEKPKLSSPFIKVTAGNHYRYECPKHGVLSGVPDEPISYLQDKAHLVQNRL